MCMLPCYSFMSYTDSTFLLIHINIIPTQRVKLRIQFEIFDNEIYNFVGFLICIPNTILIFTSDPTISFLMRLVCKINEIDNLYKYY